MHLFRSPMVILLFFTVLCYPFFFFLNEGTVFPCFYGLEVLDVEGQNHIGHICLFTTYLTLLISYNKTGVNWSFVFKKQGQNRTKQKGGAKSPLALKTGARTPKPLVYTVHQNMHACQHSPPVFPICSILCNHYSILLICFHPLLVHYSLHMIN